MLSIIFISVMAFNSYATPSFMWYATHSVENYVGNGCSGSNLGTCHEDADGFSAAVNGHTISNKWYRYNRRDTACTAARWVGTGAETNYVDFLFYAGHGDGSGPFLGCSSTYTLDSWNDLRFGASGYLKWVQAAACLWFVDSAFGMTKWQRWDAAFTGVHVVMGHKALTYDHSYSNQMSDNFWDLWVDSGWGVTSAWLEAQIRWVYTEAGNPGLLPAGMAPNSTYGTETWAAATDVKAPNGAGILYSRTAGTPQY